MSSLLSQICQLSKGLFRSVKPNRELFTYMFFLILSGAIWLAVTLNENYEREVNIPVLITGVPESVAFDKGLEDTIRVTIRGKGFSLVYYQYTKEKPQLAIDFNTYKKKDGHLMVSNADLRRLIGQYLEGVISIGTIKPDKLDYAYAECVERVVPVRLVGTIEPAENYYLAETIIDPAQVKIYLSRSMIDSVKFVTTEDLNIVNFSDTTSFEANLKPIKGVNMSKKKVHVTLFADILTEAETEIPITAVNVPDGLSMRFFPQRVKVKYVVGVSMLRDINIDDFVVQVDYSKIEPGSDKCNISLVQKPHGIVKADALITQVDYLVEN